MHINSSLIFNSSYHLRYRCQAVITSQTWLQASVTELAPSITTEFWWLPHAFPNLYLKSILFISKGGLHTIKTSHLQPNKVCSMPSAIIYMSFSCRSKLSSGVTTLSFPDFTKNNSKKLRFVLGPKVPFNLARPHQLEKSDCCHSTHRLPSCLIPYFFVHQTMDTSWLVSFCV